MSPAQQVAGRALRDVVGDLLDVPPSVKVSDLALDSRRVVPGSAFLACRGRTTHGLAFAARAVANGARAVLYEPDAALAVPDFGSAIFVAPVPDLGAHVGAIADRFFGEPSRALTIAGITGTNGKTTCAWLLAQALGDLGRRGAYLGTLGVGIPPAIVAADLTTPDALAVHRELAALRAAGAECVAMEVSSHALDQHRVAAVRFRTAAFTNLTRDHLDYHGSMQAYGAAKARLFASASLESCVVNVDDEFGAGLARTINTGVRLVLTSRGPGVDGAPGLPTALGTSRSQGWVRADHVAIGARGLDVVIGSSFGHGHLESRLLGAFNVENLLTTLAILLDWKVPMDAACAALGRCPAPPGRMETFGGGPLPLAIVDFAHTPDALSKALRAARAHCTGKLVAVFGCGGDRDRGKRPLMARAAAALADEVVVTDDNPRSEDAAQIVAEITSGLPPGARSRVQHDRRAAIGEALRDARAGDVVLVAGKGHEAYQIYGTERRSFSDQDVVRAAFAERDGGQGAGSMKRTLADLANACGGVLQGADREYAGVSSDTRSIGAGDLFVALRGPIFNGNDFVAAALAAGASGALVDTPQPCALPQVVVPDTQAALVAAARAWRSQFAIPLIGVAGSNGKTTAKEMTTAILSVAGATLSTRGNLNNHIGVPLTVLRLAPEHRFAVIEMGANRAGEVAELVAIARPATGLVTNAGAEHLEGFGSLEGVARAEGEMFAGLPATGVAVMNADDPFAELWRGMTAATVRSFGIDAAADFHATDIVADVAAGGFVTRFTLVTPAGETRVSMPLGGLHNVRNALGAAAAATAAGASLAHVVTGLAAMRAVPGRLQFKLARNGAWIIDDSYNANPSSMRVAIDVLAALAGPRWLVIGDMAELGTFAEASHVEIGAYARERGIERLCATGALAALAVESFGPGAQWYPDAAALSSALLAGLGADARVLVKGSRFNRLERVVAALVGGGS